MQAYGIKYMVDGKTYDTTIDAKDAKSAREKLGKKHRYKSGRKIKVLDLMVIGYY